MCSTARDFFVRQGLRTGYLIQKFCQFLICIGHIQPERPRKPPQRPDNSDGPLLFFVPKKRPFGARLLKRRRGGIKDYVLHHSMNPRPVNFRGGRPGRKTPDERGTSHAFSDPYEHFRGGRLPGPDAPSLDLVHPAPIWRQSSGPPGASAPPARPLSFGTWTPGFRPPAWSPPPPRLCWSAPPAPRPPLTATPPPGRLSPEAHPAERAFTALRRCARLWWDSLERLEILLRPPPGPPPPV